MFKAVQWNFFFSTEWCCQGGVSWCYGSTGFWDSPFLCVSTLYLLKTHMVLYAYYKNKHSTQGRQIADAHFLFLKFQVAVCSLLESQRSSTVCSLWVEQKRLSVTKCCVVPHLQPVFVYACSCRVDNTSETPGFATCAHLWYCHVYCHLSELPQTNVHSRS